MSDINILDKMIDISQDKEKKDFSPQEIVASLLSLLKSRQAQILRLRHGLDNGEAKTLNQVGEKLELTRERIRQLEKQALNNIIKNSKYNEIITPLRHLVQQILESHGGLMSLKSIKQELILLSKNHEKEQASIKFLLSNCVTGVEKIKNSDFNPSLKLISASLDNINLVLAELEKIFIQKNRVLQLDEIVKKFKQSEYYQNNKEKFSSQNIEVDKIIFSYLDASQKFIQTPLGQWGLASWPDVTPRRINGKIYLVMLAKKKPMHFSKITEIINQKWTEAGNVSPATVHNELIADKRFILVGRGIYGLKNWGYEGRRVQEIVKDILDKNKDISQEEIIQKVKEKKMVKESTIRMAIRKYRIK